MTEPCRPSPPATSISQGHLSAKGLQHRGTYGTENHLVFHQDFQEEWKPLRVRELIRPLTVRQVSHCFGFLFTLQYYSNSKLSTITNQLYTVD